MLCVFTNLIVVWCVLGLVPPGFLRSWKVLMERTLSGRRHSPQEVINRAPCCETSPNRSLSNIYLGTVAGGDSGPGWRRGKFWPSCSLVVSGGTPGSRPHSRGAIGIMGMGFDNCSRTHTHLWCCSHVQGSRLRHPTQETADPHPSHQEVSSGDPLRYLHLSPQSNGPHRLDCNRTECTF